MLYSSGHDSERGHSSDSSVLFWHRWANRSEATILEPGTIATVFVVPAQMGQCERGYGSGSRNNSNCLDLFTSYSFIYVLAIQYPKYIV